ncbi:MAG: hypothetical protein NC339_01390 [Muribaculaceae bacterium]|nr:hypothetical protein [Muribaculaceae bacterium]
MLKRLTILSLFAAMLSLTMGASIATGTIQSFPVAGDYTHLIDTDEMVWYVTGGRLNSYDKKMDETRTYVAGQDLSDHSVKNIYYNAERKYLAVVYDNSNIDLIYYRTGDVANLPDIKDANVNALKGVNAVAFHADNIYVATEFGLVIFDESRHEVKESGIYNGHGITALGALDKGLILVPTGFPEASTPLMFHEYGTRIHKFDNFKTVGYTWGVCSSLTPINSNALVGLLWGKVKQIKLSDDCSSVSTPDVFNVDGISVSGFTPTPDDGVYFVGSDSLVRHITNEGALETRTWALPSSLKGNLISTVKGPETALWAAADEGLGQYRLGSDGAVTVLTDRRRVSGATSFSNVARVVPSTRGNGFLISNMGESQYHPSRGGSDTKFKGDVYRNGEFSRLTADNLTYTSSQGQLQFDLRGPGLFNPSWLTDDPDVEGRVYVSSRLEGLYVLENGRQVAHFDESNSLIPRVWVYQSQFVGIDHQGNLWVTSFAYGNTQVAAVAMLPAAKRRQADLSKITRDDWVKVDFGGQVASTDSRLLFCRGSNIILAFDSFANYALEAIQHDGTIANTANHRRAGWASVTDSDGKSFQPLHWVCGVEDQRGQVWLGTSMGVAVIPNPNSVMSSSFTINRVKVPRNDGTNLADYLLENELILCIAVDHSNRKWIGTENSGLYLVSENGDEILETYTTSNSSLPSNTINGLYVDPESNSLFVGTPSGLFELSTTSGPAREDFSEVYAYPNPVTPDYTGWVTIQGLMENSMVKIVDADMHLVYQTSSEGGMAVWDGCNMNGQRVKTGVYYVMASSGSETSSTGAVATKILVVN